MGAARMNPRASTPSTRSTAVPSKRSAMPSTAERKAAASARSGVRSLKVIPGLGKSRMSRTRAAKRSATSTPPTSPRYCLVRGALAARELPLAALARPRLDRRGAPASAGAGRAAGRRGPGHLGLLLLEELVVLGDVVVGQGRRAALDARLGGRATRAARGREAWLGPRPAGGGEAAAAALESLAQGRPSGLPLLEDGREGRGDEDRRVGPRGQADEQGEGELLE